MKRPQSSWPSTEPSQAVNLDHDRGRRRGIPEAIFCEGKDSGQLLQVAQEVLARETPTLFTRVREDQVEVLMSALPDAHHDQIGRLIAWPGVPVEPSGGRVVVAAAGTSDLPVAHEAASTVRFLGRECELVVDIGVAGIHRLFARLDTIRSADAVIVVAGMDGALPGVVAGLVAAPVIAVPTSVGYGAAFGGIAPLLTMLNACAPGVCVVNIDNGYGAGHIAVQMTRYTAPR